MAKLFVIAAIAAVALAGGSLRIPDHSVLLTEQQVAEINGKAATWTANYTLVHGMTKEQARGMIGAYSKEHNFPKADWGALPQNFKAPVNFDARVQWANCTNYIRDQQQCGSCWAFGATTVLSDRYCIKGRKVLLSPQYLVSCDNSNFACNGGYLDVAWSFLEKVGAPLDTCVRYKSGTSLLKGTCPRKCDNGSRLTLHKAKLTKSIVGVESIQLEVMTNGPIEVMFEVFEDFYAYQSGVYQRTSDVSGGWHAVKLIGWGQENGVNYWLCANSWNTWWGEQGYFKIAFGHGNNDIETFGVAGVPAI
jgi:cathepsin B